LDTEAEIMLIWARLEKIEGKPEPKKEDEK